MDTEYDDNYPTCVETYATLRVYGEAHDPDAISRILTLTPTKTQTRGQPLREGASTLAKLSGWFLTSDGSVESKDSRRHIDWLLERLASSAAGVQQLRNQGMRFDICCYWLSVGQGGPTLSPKQTRILADLEIEVWFDIYFGDSNA